MIQQRANFDWMLKELADGVYPASSRSSCSPPTDCASPGTAATPTPPTASPRPVPDCRAWPAPSPTEIPDSDGKMSMVIIEIDGGYFYLMAAGANAYLAVLADEIVDAGLMGARMRDLVVRIGAHLTSPPRRNGQTV